MAFRRRRTFTRKPFRRRSRFGKRPMARANFDKITLFNNLDAQFNGECQPEAIPGCSRFDPSCGNTGPTTCLDRDGNTAPSLGAPGGNCRCCVNLLEYNLMSNSVLEQFYQDRVTLMRIYGDVFWRVVPSYPVTEECNPGIAKIWLREFIQSFGYQWNMSIRKKLFTQAQIAPVPGFENFDASSPIFGYDWTESSPPWNLQRSGVWMPRPELTRTDMAQGSIVGVCSDVSGGSLLNPLTSGTGNINTSIDTSCSVIQAPLEGCPQTVNGVKASLTPWHHLRIRHKRHIVMARDQALNLVLAVRLLDRNTVFQTGSWACADYSAFPAPLNTLLGQYRVETFARIGGTIKYN